MSESETGIFVLPSKGNDPPRAILFEIPEEAKTEDFTVSETEGVLVTWSRDMATWLSTNGNPVPQGLAEAITAHAKELGVKW